MKVGDLVSIPELNEEGDVIGNYCIDVGYMKHDGSGNFEDPGPLMVMKTATTNEGRLLVMVQLLTEISEWISDDPNNTWDYVDQHGYRLISSN